MSNNPNREKSPAMSRRKMKGLTRLGRMVSEDPDIDNLLSTLSPEQVEELVEDIKQIPDLDPTEGKIVIQGESQTVTKGDTQHHSDPKRRLGQRESFEDIHPLVQRTNALQGIPPSATSYNSDPKKDSRKQEYLRKRGLSQEGNDDKKIAVGRQAGVSCERDTRMEDSNNKGPECSKEERNRLSSRYRKEERREGDMKEDTKEKGKCEESKLKDRREFRESIGSKTKDMISKLQEKKEDVKEERKEDCRKRDASKTKDIISKLREKSEKETKERKEDARTRGLVSKIVEKQSKTQETLESKLDENKSKGDDRSPEDNKSMPDMALERQKSEKAETSTQLKDHTVEKRKTKGEDVKQNYHEREERKISKEENLEGREDRKGKVINNDDSNKAKQTKQLGICVASKIPNSKAVDEEEEVDNEVDDEVDDEDSSMFDELMEQVRGNKPSLLELNVNNSEVIKTNTLILFAEALHHNTHVKSFALANCRADDHVAYAIAGTLRNNKTITSINLDSNHLTGKGIMFLIQALQHNSTLTELRFHNQRHICGGKTEMEMTKVLKDNTTLLKLGYHFELAGPRMTMTNILSRNVDRQRQKRLQEQKQAQANGEKKGTLEVPKTGCGGSLRGSPLASPKPSPIPSPMPSPKLTPKKREGCTSPPPPPPPPPPGGGPPPPPPPMLDMDSLKNSLTPISRRKLDGKSLSGGKNSRDQLLDSIRGSNVHQLKKVPVPKWLQ